MYEKIIIKNNSLFFIKKKKEKISLKRMGTFGKVLTEAEKSEVFSEINNRHFQKIKVRALTTITPKA